MAVFDWLAARVPAAAVDLLKAIGRAEIHLSRNPGIYRVVRGNPFGDIRRVNLRPFRYQLYFQIVAAEVVVIACLHAGRSPQVHTQILSDRV
jgi:plasmid stabilization system protein ParE